MLEFELEWPPKAHVLSRLSPQPLVLQASGQTFRRWSLEEKRLCAISLFFFPGRQEVS